LVKSTADGSIFVEGIMPKFITFLGGPLDGHKQELTEREDSLPNVLNVEISPNTFRLMENRPMIADASPTSRATYSLKFVAGVATYRFVGPQRPAKKPAGR
jgi:hypothetical protein